MRKILLATTAAALVLAAQGLAQAQTGSSDKASKQQQTTPSTPSTTGAASQPSSGQPSPGTTTGQSNTGASTSSTAQQTNPPATGSSSTTAPTQAQSSPQTPSGTNTNSTAQQQPSGTTNTAQQPRTNTNTAQQPSGTTNTNTAQQPSGNTKTNTAQQPSGNTGTSTAQQPSSTTTAQGSRTDTNASVNINEQQRSRLSQTFAKLDVRPQTNVNFQVSVGAVVPRDVRLETLPSDVVAIVPQFRGYSFFAVRDEIVIVEPSSMKIVAVLPRSGGGSASTTTTRKSTFSDEDRSVMRKHVHVGARTQAPTTTGSSTRTKVIIGERVPESVEIRSFPEEVYRESPRLKEYRYIEEGDRAYVVEPHDRRIIEEIE